MNNNKPGLPEKTTHSSPRPRARRRLLTPKVLLLAGATLVIALSAAVTVVFMRQQFMPSAGKEAEAAEKELEKVVSAVEKLIIIPEEVPTIATVTDRNLLSAQPFFSRAENGDKVLIFTESQKAILYRPSANKIIEVAPINTTGQLPQDQTAPTELQTEQVIPVSILGSSGDDSTAAAAELKLTQANLPIRIIETSTSKQPYTETLVVDVTGKNSELAATIASLLEANTGALPDGELPPSTTEILIIVGQSE